jgi:hypothetical protein
MQNRNTMRCKLFGVCVLIYVSEALFCSAANITMLDDSQLSSSSLSRKKRYLSFPSGSVLQVRISQNSKSTTVNCCVADRNKLHGHNCLTSKLFCNVICRIFWTNSWLIHKLYSTNHKFPKLQVLICMWW